MNADAYQDAALSTEIPEPIPGHPVLYPALGLGDEAGEVAGKLRLLKAGKVSREAFLDEVGDVLWYLAVLAHKLDLRLSDIESEETDPAGPGEPEELDDLVFMLVEGTGQVLGRVKKLYRDRSGQRDEAWTEDVLPGLKTTYRALHRMASLDDGPGLGHVMAANADKVQSRKMRGLLRGEGDTR